MKIFITLSIFFIICLSTVTAGPVIIPNDKLTSTNLFLDLLAFKERIFQAAKSAATNFSSVVQADLTKVLITAKSLLKQLNIPTNFTLTFNATSCSNDFKVLLRSAQVLLTVCPGRRVEFNKNLLVVYKNLGQLLYDCTGNNTLAELKPQLQFFGIDLSKAALCASSLVKSVPVIATLIPVLSSVSIATLNSTIASIKAALPTVKAIIVACKLTDVFAEPTGDDKATQDSCLNTVKQAKAVFEDFAADVKTLNVFEVSADIEGVFGAFEQIIGECKKIIPSA